MKGFWTCGPFKEADDRRERMSFRIEQMEKFLSILENLETIEKQITSGSVEEIYIGMMMKEDAERDLRTILGIKDDRQEQDQEILREAILESLTRPKEE